MLNKLLYFTGIPLNNQTIEGKTLANLNPWVFMGIILAICIIVGVIVIVSIVLLLKNNNSLKNKDKDV